MGDNKSKHNAECGLYFEKNIGVVRHVNLAVNSVE
jgi:hypothetical protein